MVEVFEFEGQKYEIVKLSDTGDAYSQALLTAHLYQTSLDSKAIDSIKECSRCGQPMSDGGERGFVADGEAYSFCSDDCCYQFDGEHDMGFFDHD